MPLGQRRPAQRLPAMRPVHSPAEHQPQPISAHSDHLYNILVNSKSGGQFGGNLLSTYPSVLNTNQVYATLGSLKQHGDVLASAIENNRMDAQVSHAFHSERKLHPEKFRNQLSRILVFLGLAICFNKMHLSSNNILYRKKFLDVRSGCKFWFTERHDGLIEIVGFRNVLHGLVLLAIANVVRFEFRKGAANHTFMRMDGEPWKQPLPADDDTVVVETSHFGQVSMLSTPSCRSRSMSDPSSSTTCYDEDNNGTDDGETADGFEEKRKFQIPG
ncbi:hypothetical protein GQ457_13G003010 [Hibiscus cannabinus]